MPKFMANHTVLRIMASLAIILAVVVLAATFRGRPTEQGGGLAYQQPGDWRTGVGGVFESSNTNSRFALVDAIVSNQSFNLTVAQARLAVPDAVYVDGRFATIFMPGVSIVSAPFYKLGQQFGLAQAFAFGSTLLAALINVALIFVLGRTLKLGRYASLLGGIIFILATNALAYAHTLTQHHLSTITILASLLLVAKKPSTVRNLCFGVLAGASLLLDIPNLFMLLPVGLVLLAQHFSVHTAENAQRFTIDLRAIWMAVGVTPLIGFFLWYNAMTFGSPFSYGQQFSRTDYFDTEQEKQLKQSQAQFDDEFGDRLPLGTRQQLRSSYILLLSDERSWLFYSPIVLFGVLGCIGALHNHAKDPRRRLVVTAIGIVLMNIVVYSMFGDPWGGWSFGPRYLIPAASILSLFAAVAVVTYRSKIVMRAAFVVVGLYSIAISALGAVTTLSIPPKVEATQLANPLPYTYAYNVQLLEQGLNAALLFNSTLHQWLSSHQYWALVVVLASTSFVLLFAASVAEPPESTISIKHQKPS